ncbi:ORF129 [Staphylococcus phage 187]|uniref:ORF129 n=1 Tax=Staphylococcus phage 187 TaxID=2908096 RepID=Q4ZDZ6_9CAUD|nr:ORF129 [Staphylococcus phage 187]AAX90751.1 ORF129 [Staphylococcus phage 187]
MNKIVNTVISNVHLIVIEHFMTYFFVPQISVSIAIIDYYILRL